MRERCTREQPVSGSQSPRSSSLGGRQRSELAIERGGRHAALRHVVPLTEMTALSAILQPPRTATTALHPNPQMN